jgi:uncharacterized protein YecA (UPF0149 family)
MQLELTPIQIEIVDFVTKGYSLVEVVDRKDVDRHTLVDWRRSNPAFNEALEQAIRDRETLNRERMLAFGWIATTTLRKIMEDDKASPSIRLRAAQTVLKAAAAIRKSESSAAALDSPETREETEVETENVHNPAQSPIRPAVQPGRNTICPCGSGIKFKRCCANGVAQGTSQGAPQSAPQAIDAAA